VRTTRRYSPLALAAAALLLAGNTGCASAMDEMRAPSPGARAQILEGEVRAVDARRGQLQLRERSGRTHTVRLDNRTDVVYRQRRYPVSALERGDIVRVRVLRRNNTNWADRVEVRETARDARMARSRTDGRGVGVGTRVERLDGTVGVVDARRGYFTVRRTRQPDVTVYVPRRMGRDDERRLDRLRRGERVRVEVRGLDRNNRAEFVRFR
jgi:hypothetical protein